MALAVNTPTHLRGIGLLPPETQGEKKRDASREDIGYLFHVALQKVEISITIKLGIHLIELSLLDLS
jgi:hypothetical protein